MRNRIFAVLAIAVLAGGGLAYGTYNLMQTQPVDQTVAAPTQPVVVAAAICSSAPSSRRKTCRSSSFPTARRPRVLREVRRIVGRGLIVPIVKNEPILAAKLASKEAGSGLPPVIPEGMRAVSVRVNEVVGVAGYVLPGTASTSSPPRARPSSTATRPRRSSCPTCRC